jgi:hypothetical protein
VFASPAAGSVLKKKQAGHLATTGLANTILFRSLHPLEEAGGTYLTK